MVTEASVVMLGHVVLLAAFGLSAVFGALVQRTDFCTMGAVADIVTMGSWDRMRQWALAAAVAIGGFAVLAALGLINAADSLYAGYRWLWLSSIVGGGMFGVGMVLASGCLSKNLVRLGGGNLKSLVVLLVAAVFAYMTLRGLTGVWRVRTVDRIYVAFDGPATLGFVAQDMLGLGSAWGMLLPALLIGGLLALWALADRDFLRPVNLLAGLGIGLVVILMWWVSGRLGFVPEDPHTLEAVYLATRSGRMEALTFTAPLAYSLDWLMFYSDSSQHLTTAVASVAGVIAGSCAQALASRRFHWQSFRTTEDLVRHLLGGALMGVGGVTALGCTIGEGLSGISNLSLTSFTAVASIIGGAVLAVNYQAWRLGRAV